MEINFESEFTVTAKEQAAYIEAIKEYITKNGEDADLLTGVKLLLVKGDPESCEVEYRLEGRKFERIRRITGYLVGTTDRWNNAKREELKDRVKHAA